MSEAALFFLFPATVAVFLWAGALDSWRGGRKLAAAALASWGTVGTFMTLVLLRII